MQQQFVTGVSHLYAIFQWDFEEEKTIRGRELNYKNSVEYMELFHFIMGMFLM
jgi:hypothetical protein